MSQPLTRDIGRFAAETGFDDLPRDVVRSVSLGFTDCCAVMLAGSAEPAVDHVRQLFAPGAKLPFGDAGLPAHTRALIAGTAAHVLDYDDVALDGHPSAVLVPALLSLSRSHRANGRDLVTAYAVGFEVWAELIRRDRDHHHNKGWHPTTVFGAVAAAAACSSLLRLSPEAAANAVAISASLAGGLAANFGSMTKSFQVGRAAEAGVIAAELAATGFTGTRDTIEHPRGFLAAISPSGRFDVDHPSALGRNWRLAATGLNIKQYPICYCAHRAVDAVVDLLAKRPMKSDEIARIDVHLGRTASNILRETLATTALEAKFSLEFAMASAVVTGRVGLVELDDGFVRSAPVQDLMRRVSRHFVEDDEESDLPLARADRVSIITTAGEELRSRDVVHARGSPAQALEVERLWRKFEECAAPLARDQCRALFDRLMRLETASGEPATADLVFGLPERVQYA
jgi:2-methylcitrate dehydratase PrpD